MRVVTVDLHYYPSQRQNQKRSGACEKRHKEEMGLRKISRDKRVTNSSSLVASRNHVNQSTACKAFHRNKIRKDSDWEKLHVTRWMNSQRFWTQAFMHSAPSDSKALPPLFFFFFPGAVGCFSVHSLSHIFSQKILTSTELPSPPLLPSPLRSVILTVTHPPKNLKSEFNLQLSIQLLGSFAIWFSILLSYILELWSAGGSMGTRVSWHVYRQAIKRMLETGHRIWGTPLHPLLSP